MCRPRPCPSWLASASLYAKHVADARAPTRTTTGAGHNHERNEPIAPHHSACITHHFPALPPSPSGLQPSASLSKRTHRASRRPERAGMPGFISAKCASAKRTHRIRDIAAKSTIPPHRARRNKAVPPTPQVIIPAALSAFGLQLHCRNEPTVHPGSPFSLQPLAFRLILETNPRRRPLPLRPFCLSTSVSSWSVIDHLRVHKF